MESMAGPGTKFAEYVVVGGGASGAVLAARLVEFGHSVCLIEHGPDDAGRSEIADLSNWPALLHSEYDYGYVVEPDSRGNSSIVMSRGKVLGGSGSINGCAAWRAPDRDLDAWVKAGATGWDADAMRPAFDRVLARTGFEYAPKTSAVATDMVAACGRLGIAQRDLDADGSSVGCGWVAFSKRGMSRQSSPAVYLRPLAGDARLQLVTKTQAQRIEFDGDRATCVVTSAGSIHAEKEIIVSCGSIDTPKLLMLSGIGPREELLNLGIDVRLDLPVGRHLIDHPEGVIIFQLKPGRESSATFGADTVILASLANRLEPDVMIWLFEGHFDDYSVNATSDVDTRYISFSPDVLYPRSEGRVLLRTADPSDPPRIDLNYFSDPHDTDLMIRALRFVRRLAATSPLASWIECEMSPGDAVETDADLEANVRQTSYTAYHPAGTCRMGSPSDYRTVVGPDLRVHGTENLRVADASIFPTMIGVNPNITCMAIGEHAAQGIHDAALPHAYQRPPE